MKKIFKIKYIYIIASFFIWFPVVAWKFGLIYSDNLLEKLVKK